MSSELFLISELGLLVQEAKRKHPDVRDAAEKALALLKSDAGRSGQMWSPDGPLAEDLVAPVVLGMKARNSPKIVALCIGSMQRLVSLRAVSETRLRAFIQDLQVVTSQGVVDIQLKALQAILVILTIGPIHASLLGDAFRVCFELRDSRTPVVSSTAAASLRQGVMVTFDKIIEEDERSREGGAEEMIGSIPTTLPDGSIADLHPSALDGFHLFQDLCTLATASPPTTEQHLLKLTNLPRPFGLELIESTLSNHSSVFKSHVELLLLLRGSLCPLLIRNLSLPTASLTASFPLTLRLVRVVFLLLRSFSDELQAESDAFLGLLIKIVSGDTSSSLDASHATSPPEEKDGSLSPTPTMTSGRFHNHGKRDPPTPVWFRVLAMECLRGLCADASLLRRVWERDSDPASTTGLFPLLLSTFNRIATEKPTLLGVSGEMGGLGIFHAESSLLSPDGNSASGAGGGSSADPYGLGMMAGMVASGVSTVVASLSSENTGLGPSSVVKVQCIDQLDKLEPPPLPETYIYLLSLQCVHVIVEGFSATITPMYATIVPLHGPLIQAKLDKGGNTDLDGEKLAVTTKAMVEAGWPAILAALSFFLGRNLSDDLFVDILASLQESTIICGLLGLNTERDAFLATLSRFAIPSAVVSALASSDILSTPKSPSMMAGVEALGFTALTGGSSSSFSSNSPSLSTRNLACLKALISVVEILAGDLGKAWFDVLEALQSASFVLMPKKTSGGGGGSGGISRRVTSHSLVVPPSPNSRWNSTSTRDGGQSSTSPTQSSFNASSHRGHTHTAAHLSHSDQLVDLDVEAIQASINHVFEVCVACLNDSAFTDFVEALCRLSGEMVGIHPAPASLIIDRAGEIGSSGGSVHGGSTTDLAAPENPGPARRRASGMHTLKSNRQHGDRSFAIAKIAQISALNLDRLVANDPLQGWSTIVNHLLVVLGNATSSTTNRLQAAETLNEILTLSIRAASAQSEDIQARTQHLVLSSLARQVEPLSYGPSHQAEVDIRRLALEALYQILQSTGHALVTWEMVFTCLRSVCRKAPEQLETLPEGGEPPSSPSLRPVGLRPSSLGVASRGNAALVRTAFQSVTLIITDFLLSLSIVDLRQCVTVLADFSRQSDDVNISLSSIGSLWNVSDAVQSRRSGPEGAGYDDLWLFIIRELLGCCLDPRAEVRSSSMQTLFRSIETYGSSLSNQLWTPCLFEIIFPLFDSLDAFVTASDDPKWVESKVLAVQSVGSILAHYFAPNIAALPEAPKIWKRFLDYVDSAFASGSPAVSTAAINALQDVLIAWVAEPSATITEALIDDTWTTWDTMGVSVRRSADLDPSTAFFTQDNLRVLVTTLTPLLRLLRSNVDGEGQRKSLNQPQLASLLAILKSVIIHPPGEDIRPDVDSLTPLQAAVFAAYEALDLNATPGAAMLVLQDLSGLVTLAYAPASLGEGEAVAAGGGGTEKRRVTYIAVCKHALAMALDVFLAHQGERELLSSGSVEHLIKALALPIKLKYEGPPSSRYGNDAPLWKTATDHFLRFIKPCCSVLASSENPLARESFEAIWSQILDLFAGALLADCSSAEALPFDAQYADETFDLRLLSSLETDIIPILGFPSVPDDLIARLGRVLQHASKFYEFETELSPALVGTTFTKAAPVSRVDEWLRGGLDGQEIFGTTAEIIGLPRERFRRWCFDLLFIVVQRTEDDSERRKRLARICTPFLMQRCSTVLASYLADQPLRGAMPFSRIREEELVYVLKKLLELSVFPDTFPAPALSSPPRSSSCSSDVKPSPQSIRTLILNTSSKAHLFALYPRLLELVLSPSKGAGGSAAVEDGFLPIGSGFDGEDEIIGGKLDARMLAGECLALLGRELMQ